MSQQQDFHVFRAMASELQDLVWFHAAGHIVRPRIVRIQFSTMLGRWKCEDSADLTPSPKEKVQLMLTCKASHGAVRRFFREPFYQGLSPMGFFRPQADECSLQRETIFVRLLDGETPHRNLWENGVRWVEEIFRVRHVMGSLKDLIRIEEGAPDVDRLNGFMDLLWAGHREPDPWCIALQTYTVLLGDPEDGAVEWDDLIVVPAHYTPVVAAAGHFQTVQDLYSRAILEERTCPRTRLWKQFWSQRGDFVRPRLFFAWPREQVV
ncbi:hypothetical protein NKR23_g10754 [Pleurostoma richardsiae]|uniref:Uncharacterized protein n=1 Tax=Pleurostoma richardsiae TaxID=41990 RepID=A0AA38VE02_9PEZI|nr:hypothetical protein NKR23_g10754 [Pleurostoma richardsiae]